MNPIPNDTSYRSLAATLLALVSDDEPLVTLYSNCAALLFHSLSRINWAGFYLFDGAQLVLGPFGGKPACTVIAMGKGVCGTAAARQEIIVVEDVDQFPGHIACDDASRSEIVLPLVASDGRLIGVLDIDSPELARFSADDALGLAAIRDEIVRKIEANRYKSALLRI